MVGERQSYEASVPATASTEIYEVLWNGEFDMNHIMISPLSKDELNHIFKE